MTLVLRRAAAVLLLVAAAVACTAVFVAGAPVAAGAAFQEPVGTVCVDPWVERHPGDLEPDVDGHWSWWPPGITCVHEGGAVFLEPTASDAAAVGLFGVVVLLFGLGPTVPVARWLWRGHSPADRARG